MTVSEEMERLLPWHLTGRLSEEERGRVEAYLADHPEAAKQLELIREESESAIVSNEALGAPRGGGLDRLLSQIEAEEGPERVRVLGRLSAWFSSFDMPAYQMAVAAAVVVIIAQAVVIGALVTGGPGEHGYETATGPQAGRIENGASASPDLLIGFAEQATAGEIAGLLGEIKVTIVDGPKAGGLYEVRFTDGKPAAKEIDAIVEKLQKRSQLVSFVSRTD